MTCAPENSNIRSVYTKKNGNDEAGENAEMKEMKWFMDIVKNLTILTPVSYTHLDVYKRQDYGGDQAL